jgi:hypothetical protein
MVEVDPETAGDLQGSRRDTINSARLSMGSTSCRHDSDHSGIDLAGPRARAAQASQAMAMQLEQQDEPVPL